MARAPFAPTYVIAEKGARAILKPNPAALI